MPLSLALGPEIRGKFSNVGPAPTPQSKWTGGGSTNNFSDAANWDVAPIVGSDLIFAGTTRLTPNNDATPGTVFGSVTFDNTAGAFVVGGNSVSGVMSIINNSSNNQTINTAIVATANLAVEAATQKITINGVISGSGSVIKSGSSALELISTNTFSGGFTLDSGTVIPNSSGVFGSGVVTVTNGIIAGNLGNNPNFANNFVLNGVMTVLVPFGGGFDVEFSGVISGSGSISIVSDVNGRRVVLSNSNTFSGGVILGTTTDKARLQVSTNSSLGSGVLTIDQSGAAGVETLNNGLVIPNNVVINTGKSLTLQNGVGQSVTLSGVISGAGSLVSYANTGSSVTLAGSNTFSGGTSVPSGTLIAPGASSLGVGGGVSVSGILNLTAGASTDYSGINTLSGSGVVNITVGTTTQTVDCSAATDWSSFTGVMNVGVGASAGAGKFMIPRSVGGAATINVLTNATLYTTWRVASATYNGSVVLNGGNTGESFGQLRLENGCTWAGSVILAGTITGSGNGFIGGVAGATQTISGVVSETGGVRNLSKVGSSTIALATTGTYTGTTTISQGVLVIKANYSTSVFDTASGATIELNVASGINDYPSCSFTGAGTLRKTGAGTALWGGGSVVFAVGTVIDIIEGVFVGGANANDIWSGNQSNLSIASGATLDGVEANVIVGKVDGAGSFFSGYPGAGYDRVKFGVANATGGVFSGVLADKYAGGNFEKIGTGTQTLSGANTYTGSTTVSAGKLVVNGSLSTSSAVTVGGGELGGSGTIGGSIAVNSGAKLTPGPDGSVGALACSSTLSFASGSSYDVTTGGGSSASQANVAGSCSLGGVTVNFAGSLNAGSYTIITSTGMSGSAAQGTPPSGRTWVSLTVVGNNLVAVFS